ncbi:MAG: hypothetical protein FWG90_05660 [Oscillospiraceae bacterium]|nr:hypothetical protein [Oscillospiraceae bacterium]
MNDRIIELVDKKIKQLEQFNEVTSRMLYEDIGEMDNLLDERDEIVRNVDGISLDIKQYVNELPIELQSKIKAIFYSQKINDLSGELLALQEKLRQQERLVSVIKEADKKAYSRLKAMQNDLLEEMTELNKTKQVANYFSQTGIDLSKGAKLNISN